ncbi:MAG TPA: nicotinate-nucleotide adenylyltransferase [Rudaea sp.]|jgi:nicotinate-nucleotide adenylyltransferase|nr:nicotinate-nucleotide adenylyltransferase [Rudaea sp.]
MKPIVLFGGTFDPVHIGHLRVALEAAEMLDANVRLMPANTPPHRPAPVATAAQRTALLERAIAGQPRLSVDARELKRNGPSYTIDTLIELRREFPPEQPIAILLGDDAFAGLPTWNRWRELFELAHIIVMTRPGHGGEWSPELAEEVERRTTTIDKIPQSPSGHVLRISVTPLEISASHIRKLLASGHDVKWLVPDTILDDALLLAPYRRN